MTIKTAWQPEAEGTELPFFALIPVKIAKEIVSARPYEWEKNDEGFVLRATAYRTTCPVCSQLTVFKSEEALIDGEQSIIFCKECNAGRSEWDAIFKREQNVFDEPFLDPIMEGLMDAP